MNNEIDSIKMINNYQVNTIITLLSGWIDNRRGGKVHNNNTNKKHENE